MVMGGVGKGKEIIHHDVMDGRTVHNYHTEIS